MLELSQLVAIVGPQHVLTGEDVRMRSVRWGDDEPCRARAIVRPANTQQVSAVLSLCHAAGQMVVTHGGRTGMAGGAQAAESDLVISLERLNQIEEIDPAGRTALVGAGLIVQALQQAALQKGLCFAVDFGARGSATIGGTISTNAGGNRVMRYGMMREQVLGLEVVLADGTIVDSLKAILKDNSGFDLKHWFIGAEGTLGLVTRAVLRLRPRMVSQNTAIVILQTFEDVLNFLARMDAGLGGKLSAFEVMWSEYFEIVTQGQPNPFGGGLKANFYVLLESEGGDETKDSTHFQDLLAEALEDGSIDDAVIASSEAQRDALWALRDDIFALFALGDHLDFDVSVPKARMNQYSELVRGRVREVCPEARCITFGHIADDNLHLFVTRPDTFDPVLTGEIKAAVYQCLAGFRGSISAEHGIGVEKAPYLGLSRSPVELDLMRKLKAMLDPLGILNAGKVLRPAREAAASVSA